MAISVEGQFYLSISLDGNSDFVELEDLIELTIYEYAGNILPTFELEFTAFDETIFKSLNEGNTLDVQVGRSVGSSDTVTLHPSSLNTTKNGADSRYYRVTGFASSIKYITNHNIQITAEKSAIELALEIGGDNFTKVESNISKSNDKQKWIQPNITDKQFLNDVLMRADLGTSFPVFSITSDGTFILNDLEKSLDGGYEWKLTKEPKKDKDIVYDPDASISSQAGFINNWIGYGKELKVTNSVSGEVESVFEDPKIIMSLASELDKSSEIEKRYGGSRHISDNVAETYWSSYNHNLQSLANLSKIDNTVSFTDSFYPVKPLDIIMFNEESNTNNIVSGEEQSGLYIASGVIKTFQGKRMSTVLILNREAFNKVKNA